MTLPTDFVYSELTARLSPALKSAHMKSLKRLRYPAWRSNPDAYGLVVFFSIQVDAKATDPFSGGGFRIELENSKQRLPARGLNGRAMFHQLLTSDELTTLLNQQNRVIGSLPKPTPEQVGLYPEGPVRRQYLEYFERQSTFDSVHGWLRYGSGADVQDWADLLIPLVQPLIARASAHLSPERLALGEGCLLAGS